MRTRIDTDGDGWYVAWKDSDGRLTRVPGAPKRAHFHMARDDQDNRIAWEDGRPRYRRFYVRSLGTRQAGLWIITGVLYLGWLLFGAAYSILTALYEFCLQIDVPESINPTGYDIYDVRNEKGEIVEHDEIDANTNYAILYPTRVLLTVPVFLSLGDLFVTGTWRFCRWLFNPARTGLLSRAKVN